ncbi:hypothetical protein [Actinokineospora fastidiosa]|uniref:Uncharacterized protein n=1 Tax=Actinokineospora fastidiosa TaxID=1816 RepID=A0A918LB00_9PSEU|nr:hypothetical protein [Actinokineospora fastidiosa]GGS25872.1 hypothetical protein GCM10010171_19050 [Actinokineospora fastidiosa]
MEGVAGVLEDLLAVVSGSEQDTGWSGWGGGDEMVAELRGHLARLRVGDASGLPALRRLFAPTGALQEVALSSGWGGRYLELARRFDAAC